MLQLPQPIYDQIRQHGEAAYPSESCGILLGHFLSQETGAVKSVTQAIFTPNASPSPARHYEIAPKELIRILREARTAGREVLGFYHSHPDHPAEPSPTDLAEAHWLGCSYLITAIVKGRATDTRAFHLAGKIEEDKRFEAEEVAIEAV
jgi:proteasome lid subunit RPN8/RPN11